MPQQSTNFEITNAIGDVLRTASADSLSSTYENFFIEALNKELIGTNFEELIAAKVKSASKCVQLVFADPPSSNNCRSPYPSLSSPFQGNWGKSALKANHPSNQDFLACMRFLQKTMLSLAQIEHCTAQQQEHYAKIVKDALCELDDIKGKQWRKLQNKLLMDDRSTYDTSHYLVDYSDAAKSTIYWSSALVTAVNLIHNTNKSTCNLLLKSIATLLHGPGGSTSSLDIALLDFPIDTRSARNLLDIEPSITNYVCCPECFALYLPHIRTSNTANGCPTQCTHRITPSSKVCDANLFHLPSSKKYNKNGDVKQIKPIRSFAYQSFKSWLGRLLCRPHAESFLDSPWRTCYESKSETVSDVWEAEELRSFRGPDGRLFGDYGPNEGRYVFSLFFDFFNPYGNKQAGKISSCGVIFMVCLNLPFEIRYRPENVYLAGVIPGPRGPSGEQINHLMNPLVLELKEFWDPGIKYSKTPTCPDGKLVRCALLLFISDLGARKAVGLASHSHTFFCSYDQLPLYKINNLDMKKWHRLTFDEFSRWANRSRWAPNEDQRDELYKLSGIGWSPFQRLSYFDVTRYTVVDAMHNLLLGLVKEHVREILGITIKDERNLELNLPDEEKIHSAIQNVLDIRSTPESVQNKENKIVLQILCRSYGESDIGNKLELATRLIQKREIIEAIYKQRGILKMAFSEPVDAQSSKKGPLLAGDTLKEIRSDIRQTTLPSWMARAPSNIGEAKHGKLSADMWRTLATVHLPVTLIRLWTKPKGTERQSRALQNFMHLFCALVLGTARTTNATRSSFYTRFMLKYLDGLLDSSLYDDVTLKPNHHLALHLEEFLQRFGPTHSYWAFPFERYIGMLRKMKTNSKHDQMEITLLNTFTMAANLKSILASIRPPSNELERLHKLLLSNLDLDNAGSGSFKGQLRGRQRIDEPIVQIDLKKSKRLSSKIYNLLLHVLQERYPRAEYCHENDCLDLPRKVLIPNLVENRKRVLHRGVQYATVTTHDADSRVCIRENESWYAACIIDIFIHAREAAKDITGSRLQGTAIRKDRKDDITEAKQNRYHSAFAVVKRFKALPSGQVINPYAQYSLLRSKLISTDLIDDVEVVAFSEVVCHLACCPVTDEEWVKSKGDAAMIVLCLDRD